MSSLMYKILVVDKDPIIRKNIRIAITTRFNRNGNHTGKYLEFVETESLDHYHQEVESSDTAMVVINFGMPWFLYRRNEIRGLASRGIPTFLTYDHPYEKGQVIELSRSAPVAGYYQKPMPKDETLNNSFFDDISEDIERKLYTLPRIQRTIGVVGVGEIGTHVACKIADSLAMLWPREPGERTATEPAPRLILYNKGTRELGLKEVIRQASNIAAPRGQLEILVTNELDAIRANVGTVILGYGNREFEFEAEPPSAHGTKRTKTALDFFERYWRDTIEIYKALSQNASIIHITNPVEPLVTLGRLFINGTGVNPQSTDGEGIEGFVYNDYVRCLRKLSEWARKYASDPECALQIYGRHHGHSGILSADIKGMPLEMIAKTLSDSTINKSELRNAIRENAELIRQTSSHAAHEAAVALIPVLSSLFNMQDTYAAISIQPAEYGVFNHRVVTIGSETMRLETFWRRYFPNKTVMGIPIETRQRRRFPSINALNHGKILSEDIRECAMDQFEVRSMMLNSARKHLDEYPELIKVFDHFGEKP